MRRQLLLTLGLALIPWASPSASATPQSTRMQQRETPPHVPTIKAQPRSHTATIREMRERNSARRGSNSWAQQQRSRAESIAEQRQRDAAQAARRVPPVRVQSRSLSERREHNRRPTSLHRDRDRAKSLAQQKVEHQAAQKRLRQQLHQRQKHPRYNQVSPAERYQQQKHASHQRLQQAKRQRANSGIQKSTIAQMRQRNAAPANSYTYRRR